MGYFSPITYFFLAGIAAQSQSQNIAYTALYEVYQVPTIPSLVESNGTKISHMGRVGKCCRNACDSVCTHSSRGAAFRQNYNGTKLVHLERVQEGCRTTWYHVLL
jgi:hypothetical protein